jgi:mitogen-activated protein kinase 1/3
MDKMLQFDPRKRIDVNAALKHPWLAQLHDETAEPVAPGMISVIDIRQ